MAGKKSGLELVRGVFLKLADVGESTIHGSPSWKWRGKLLACLAIHKSAEPNSLMVKVDSAEREQLLLEEPEIYYVTNHYQGNSVVLVRLDEIDSKSLRALLKKAWRFFSEN